jgi:tRNA pseudouridine55 synthase
VLLRGRDAPILEGPVYATLRGHLVAVCEVERGELKPKRIFNLPPRGTVMPAKAGIE